MINSIIVIFSSHLSPEENNKFITHIKNTIGNIKHKVFCYENHNEYSLSEIYNRAILEHNEPNSVFVMCHNDIEIKTQNWGKILINTYNNNSNFDIIGVAGSTFLSESGVWWEDRSKMYGIVEHTDGINTWASEFSEKLSQVRKVVLIDGVFISFNANSIKYQFDEEFKGFHFYDLGFCFPNYLDGCNIGVTTSIRVLHKSVGKTNLMWEENRKQFIEKYSSELPIKHVSENKLRVLICCQFFKNYTGSEMSNYELSKELVKQGYDVTLISSLVGEPLASKAMKNGVKVYSLNTPPNYIRNNEGQLQFLKTQAEFDIIHINHKPIGELILQLYPNTPAVMHVRSEVIPLYEEPIINPQIKKYISIRQSITEYIKGFGIDEENIVEINNPFDTTRFNNNYKHKINKKEIVLFIGTLDYLREMIIRDLVKETKENNQELWLIGENSGQYADDVSSENHVTYLGVKSNVEDYIKDCDYTAGIFKGRTTIEGFLCGKPGWIYVVNTSGEIISKKLCEVPSDIKSYSAEASTKKVTELYYNVLNEF